MSKDLKFTLANMFMAIGLGLVLMLLAAVVFDTTPADVIRAFLILTD